MFARFFTSNYCTLCRQQNQGPSTLCPYCWQLFVPLHQHTLCTCSVPIWGSTAPCNSCQHHPPYFQQAFCGYRYHYPLNQLINHYKHQRLITLEACLKELWLAHVGRITTLPQALVPVPLHWRRRAWRGFNQAHRLAWFASQQSQVPLATLLSKTVATKAQQRRSKQQRHHALKGAFQYVPNGTTYSHVALIDDVLTTGSTANEAAKTLLKHGVQRVDVWALARAF